MRLPLKVNIIPTKKLAIISAAVCAIVFASSHNARAILRPLPHVTNLTSGPISGGLILGDTTPVLDGGAMVAVLGLTLVGMEVLRRQFKAA